MLSTRNRVSSRNPSIVVILLCDRSSECRLRGSDPGIIWTAKKQQYESDGKKSTDATYLIRPMKSDPDHLLKK
jgi:hypothetical protein